MSAVPPVTVRSRVAAVLEAITGWKEATTAPGLFGLDPRATLHLSFSVVLPASAAPTDQRQRLDEGARLVSDVEVRWAHRLRADAQVADYAAALTAEQDAIKAVVAIPKTDGLHCLLVSAARDDSNQTILLGTLRFTAHHRIDLQ